MTATTRTLKTGVVTAICGPERYTDRSGWEIVSWTVSVRPDNETHVEQVKYEGEGGRYPLDSRVNIAIVDPGHYVSFN
jgi:hypothetical protein